jgi:hypothetical protein
MEEAYEFLKGRTNTRDVDERLRLARWCHLHGLREQAVAEAAAALELRPDSVKCQRLLQNYQKLAAKEPAAPAPKSEPDSQADSKTTAIPICAESMGQFITKIQPILMNTCASCHARNTTGAFKLARALDGPVVNRRVVQQNLNAVLAQISPDRPETSPLLVKALSIHGDATQPPLKGRQTAAYKTLDDWVKTTIATNPQLQEKAGVAQLNSPAGPPKPANIAPRTTDLSGGETVSSGRPAVPVNAPQAPATGAAPARPIDPFDPAIFNQAFNPKGK